MGKGDHKLIFEGAELAGKSSIIHGVYNFLEEKYNTHNKILNGCHWFNSDVGIFGTEYGQEIIERYLEMSEIMGEKNIIFEKFHLSDQVYHDFYLNRFLDYSKVENKLLALNAKIILCTVKPDREIFEKRIKDRLSLYPHYKRIVQSPEDYIAQQEKYLEYAEKTQLPVLKIDLTDLPNPEAEQEVLKWIGEVE